jgi:heat shock protein HtpX
MPSMLDEETRRRHRMRNRLHSLALFASIGAVLGLATWLIWGLLGVAITAAGVAAVFFLAPRLPPDAVMRLYRARQVDKLHGGALITVVEELARRAGLERTPRLFVIPSSMLNAFATGTRSNAGIAVTEGLLRRLTMREIIGVLAHETSHVVNNDLSVMGLADVMSRLTQSMTYVALALAILNIPGTLLGDPPVSWWAILLLYIAPLLSNLLQLGLSRTREFDADLEAALLTGDPMGLASALRRLDSITGRFWEDLMMPVPARRIPVPSVLRSHPDTDERIARLLELQKQPHMPHIEVHEAPMVTMVGWGPIEMRPRYRFPGVWF